MAACRVPLWWGNWSSGAGRTGYGDLATIRNDTQVRICARNHPPTSGSLWKIGQGAFWECRVALAQG